MATSLGTSMPCVSNKFTAGTRLQHAARRLRGVPLVPAMTVQAQAATASALTLTTGTCCLPHPDKVDTGGEDAFFVSEDKSALGVADGVGGWRESGIDPGDYSRSFMRTACAFVDDAANRAGREGMKGWEELARAALAMGHKKTRLPGSATACVLVLNSQDNWVSSANLGDSGFIVVRNGTVLYQTPALQHFFDCPYQFGAFPEHVEATDYPSDAQTFSLNVVAGDVIVMGTDGLFDNCPVQEIVALLPDSDEAVPGSAERIASAARAHADDPEFSSPYIQEARAQGMDLPWWEKVMKTKIVDGRLEVGELLGGKLDDITVLVARVVEAPPPAPATEE